MNELFKTVLSLSVSGTILMFILLLLHPLYKKLLSKSWQYYIWIVVIARLLLPFTAAVTLVGSAFYHIDSKLEYALPILPSAALSSVSGGTNSASLLRLAG